LREASDIKLIRPFLFCATFLLLMVGWGQWRQPNLAHADEPSETVGISLWHSWLMEERQFLESVIDEFNLTDRDVEVTAEAFGPSAGSVAERMLLNAGSGALPDLALVERDSIPPLVDRGLIRPLDDLLRRDGESDSLLRSENLLESAAGYAAYDDELYGLPAYLNPIVLIYDPDALQAAAGISEPPTDWADFIDLAAMLKGKSTPGVRTRVMSVRSMATIFRILCLQRGGDLLEADVNAESSAIVMENLELVRAMRYRHYLFPPQHKFWDPKFAGVADGGALFQIDSAVMFAHMKRTSSRPLAAAMVPSGSDLSKTALSGSPMFVLSSTAEDGAALKFLEFFYSPERYSELIEELMIVSPWKDAIESTDGLTSDGQSYSRIVYAAEQAASLPLERYGALVMPRIARIVEMVDAKLISYRRGHQKIVRALERRRGWKRDSLPSIRVSWSESTRRLLVDDDVALRSPPIRIVAARNERESFQLILSADRAVDGLTLDFAAFSVNGDDQSGLRINAALVDDTYISKPLVSDRVGPYPNVLRPFDEVSVSPGRLTRIWFDVSVDESVPPGDYSSSIKVTHNGTIAAEAPVEVRVVSLEIPSAPSRPAFIGLNYELIASQYGLYEESKDYSELMDDFYWFLVDRRLTPLQPPVPVDSPRIAAYMDDGRVSGLRLPFGPAEESFERAVSIAEEGGWLEKTFAYFIDEPTYHQYDEILEAAERIHSLPLSPKFLVTCFPDHPLFGAVDIWGVHLSFLPQGIARGHAERKGFARLVNKRLEAGEDVWWYTAGATAPFPTLHVEDDPAAFRIIPWMQQLYGIGGFLHWEAANWSQSLDEPFVKSFGNGEGVLVYPGELGPLPSIRLELLREGFEDMELLFLLRSGIGKVQERLDAERLGDVASIRIGEICRRLIQNKALRVSATQRLVLLPHFLREPGSIEGVREEVIEEITGLEDRPYSLVLTEPREKQYTDSDEARIFGVVERRCRVTINGRRIPTDRHGGFSAQLPLSSGANHFEIMLRKGTHKKLVQRKIMRF